MLENGSDQLCNCNNNLIQNRNANDQKNRKGNNFFQKDFDINKNYDREIDNELSTDEDTGNENILRATKKKKQKRSVVLKNQDLNVKDNLTKSESSSNKSNFVHDRKNESEKVNSRVDPSKKSRNLFYQDVNEALSSLLWQPYEYQARQMSTGDRSSPPSSSLSSYSSCASLSSIDLDGLVPNNRPASALRGNAAVDLHLSASKMVNNLALYKNRLSQWQHSIEPSRDEHQATAVVPSRLSSSVSRSSTLGSYVTKDGRVDGSNNARCYCNARVIPVDKMRVEVPSDVSAAVSNVPTTSTYNAIGQSNNSVSAKVVGNKSVTATHIGDIMSANVVGLPNHPRQSSVPTKFPFAHPRNLSESNVAVTHVRQSSIPSTSTVVSHQRNRSTPSMIATGEGSLFTTNYGSNGPFVAHASTLSNSNVSARPMSGTNPGFLGSSSCGISMSQQERNANIISILNHQRHSSCIGFGVADNISKNGTELKTPNDNGITTLNVVPGQNVVTTSSSLSNISNVDVNFYRAVPCNVVSNIPTIHCVNSMDTGNNVSNVNIVQTVSSNLNSSSSSTSGSTFLSALSPKHITTVAQINGNTSVNRSFGSTITTQVTVHNESISSQNLLPSVSPQNPSEVNRTISQETQRVQIEPRTVTRTFTSTEAQTDDTAVGASLNSSRDRAVNREQRRRERRERRHHRRLNNQQHIQPSSNNQCNVSMQTNDRLPDILNSHMPPPYSPVLTNLPTTPVVPTIVPPNVLTNNIVPVPSVVGNHAVPFPPPVVPGQVPLVQGSGPVPVAMSAPSGFRFPFHATGFRRSRFSDESPKGCCSFLTWRPGSLRWFIALIALVAVCCVLVGTALGAMRPAGRDHLTVSLLMIGVGIVLVTVSGVAWRLTSHDSSTCRAMLGMGSTESVDTCPRRFVPRLPPSYGRPHHPYAAMMYPEFQYRPPPPSYQASMQEYRLRLLLLDRGNAATAAAQNGTSPPPTYRSHAGSLLRAPLSSRRDVSQSECSFPPSYRSQTSSSRAIERLTNVLHSREQSLSLSDSNHGGSVVNNVNILTNTEEDIALDNITIDSLKMVPESEINPVKMLLKGGSTDLEGNLVTIVQTGNQNPVIVTVSGCSQSDNNTSNVQITEIPSEMEILAHL